MEKNVLIRRAVAIGGSAGSLPVIIQLLSALDPQFPFPLLIVLHRKNDYESGLAQVLAHRTPLPVTEAEDKESIEPGTVYLAPANYHVLVEKDFTLSLDVSEKVHFSRPSIDVTFQTAAEAYGAGLTAVLLSGANADGTDGLLAVRKYGGRTIVQDPQEAQTPFMPDSAIRSKTVDHILDTAGIAALLNRLTADA